MKHTFKLGDETFEVMLAQKGTGYILSTGDSVLEIESVERTGSRLVLTLGGRRMVFSGKAEKDRVHVSGAEGALTFSIIHGGIEAAAEEASGGLAAPIAGQILKVLVSAGDVVEKGEMLMILEAMKMELEVYAPFSGTVKTLRFAEGERCQKGERLIEMEPRGAPGVER